MYKKFPENLLHYFFVGMIKFHQLGLQLSSLIPLRSFWLPLSHPGCQPLLYGRTTSAKDQISCLSQAWQALWHIWYVLWPSIV